MYGLDLEYLGVAARDAGRIRAPRDLGRCRSCEMSCAALLSACARDPDSDPRAGLAKNMVTGAGVYSFCPICGSGVVERLVEEEERRRLVCVACGHIIYVNPKLVAGAIPIFDGGVWLLRRAIEPRYGAWTFPAGFMEMGETVQEAAIRETREELGMEIEIGALLNLYSRPSTPTVLAVYEAVALTEPSGGSETLDFALFSPENIPWSDLAFWNTVEALQDWLAGINVPRP